MIQPLLVALPTHAGDVNRTETLLKWIAELGHVGEHNLMIAADSELPTERVKALLEMARPHFNTVRAMIVQTGVRGWPQAANMMFKAIARQIYEGYRLPWLLLEPDAVPLRACWLNELADAYLHCPKPILGCVLDSERTIEGLPDRYLAGVSIYPQDTFKMLDKRWSDARFTAAANPKLSVEQRQQNVRAFDMIFADTLVPKAQHTTLIHNHWGTAYNEPPVFVTQRTEAHPANAVTLDFIRKEAVLFHRVKDLDTFLAMWRVRLEGHKALVVEAVHRETGEASRDVDMALGPATQMDVSEVLPAPLPQVTGGLTRDPAMPAASNPNFKGGPEAKRERRRAAAQRSRDYQAEAKRKAQEAATAKQAEPASV